jgi:hypothetical protein
LGETGSERRKIQREARGYSKAEWRDVLGPGFLTNGRKLSQQRADDEGQTTNPNHRRSKYLTIKA